MHYPRIWVSHQGRGSKNAFSVVYCHWWLLLLGCDGCESLFDARLKLGHEIDADDSRVHLATILTSGGGPIESRWNILVIGDGNGGGDGYGDGSGVDADDLRVHLVTILTSGGGPIESQWHFMAMTCWNDCSSPPFSFHILVQLSRYVHMSFTNYPGMSFTWTTCCQPCWTAPPTSPPTSSSSPTASGQRRWKNLPS